MAATWTHLDPERLQCSACRAVFSISLGESCLCCTDPSADSEPSTKKPVRPRATPYVLTTEYWLRALREVRTEIRAHRREMKKLDVENKWGANLNTRARNVDSNLDMERKAIESGQRMTAGLEEEELVKRNEEVARKLEEIQERSRRH